MGGGAQNLIVTYEHIAYYNYNFCCKIIVLLWAGKKHFHHLEISYLYCYYVHGISYNVIKWSNCELKGSGVVAHN